MRWILPFASLSLLVLSPALVQAQMLTGYGAQPSSSYQPLMTGTDLFEIESHKAVDLEADQVSYDDEQKLVRASGRVRLAQGPRTLDAERVEYHMDQDTVHAAGGVVFYDEDGSIHVSEEVTLNDRLKTGTVQALQSRLNDGARFSAREGLRESDNRTVMKGASYTPCAACKTNPARSPTWQIKAAEVVHDRETRHVSYKHARFEIYGVPVFYAPYFSHPDGSVERKNGFLSPSAGYKSDLGGFFETSYYWGIAPDRDLTLGLMAMTKENPLLFGEWRQRWDEADFTLKGGVTSSERTERESGQDIVQNERLRGHVLAQGLWSIDESWRAGLDIQWASDDQYMRQYDFSDEDVLKSEIYAERFSGRDYLSGRLLAFQDIRVNQSQEDQPEILPEISASFLGDPNGVPLIGGRWSLDTSFLGLRRSAGGQDVNRLHVDGGWQRRFVSDYGFLTRLEAHVQGDLYNVRDRAVATPGSGRSRNDNEGRFFSQAYLEASYPLINQLEHHQWTFEPLFALSAAPNMSSNSDIPNEDSQDAQIDPLNLFSLSRFPGFDRLEDKSRMIYGMRTGLYGDEGQTLSLFLGQSYRFDGDDNPFPSGSGLDHQESDVVGHFSAFNGDDYALDYRFQLGSRNLTSQRHEVGAYFNRDRYQLGANYLFAKALEGTSIDESREQFKGQGAYYLSPSWRMRTGGTYDLGEDPGLREALLGFDYYGQCVSWSLTGERNLTQDSSGDSGTEIVFRLGLKNLGEFERSALR